MSFIRNAIIESVTLDIGDKGLLTAWVYLDYGGMHQGFGGYALYLPKSFTHHQMLSHAGHFIWRCMEVAGVEKWENMKGKTIRVALDRDGLGGRILGIGHIIKDDWFYPETDFKEASDGR